MTKQQNGRLIRQYRKRKDLSLERFGELLAEDLKLPKPISAPSISAWERGDNNPRPENVRAIDRVLDAQGVIVRAYGLADPREGDALAELSRQVEGLRSELAARDRLLDELLARVARLEAG